MIQLKAVRQPKKKISVDSEDKRKNRYAVTMVTKENNKKYISGRKRRI